MDLNGKTIAVTGASGMIGVYICRSLLRAGARVALHTGKNAPAELAPLWAAQWRFALLVAAVSPVAYVLVLFAMQSAPLSHVAPAREVSMLFAALIGGHLLGEGDRAARIAGALLIACGVVALALG